ncbi:unnamed protein product [Urochloa humidicola]
MGCCLSAADAAADELDPVSGTHQFTIRQYSQRKGIGSGKSILSRYFTVDGRTWYARFYPDGYTPNSQFVAFYVQTLYKPQCRPVRARFSFELLKPDGTVAYSRRSDRPRSFDRHCNCWGFRAFLTRDALESAALGVLHADSIKVRCTVDVVNSRRRGGRRNNRGGEVSGAAASLATVAPHSDFAANTMRFLKSGRAPFDVRFSVGGAVFEAHGLAVAAQSEWFAAALYGHGEEGRWAEAGMPCVAVSGTTPEAFEGVLHYIYHDELPEEQLIRAGGGGEAAMTRELFEAADMFLIERMKGMCARRLCRFIKEDTVRGILELAQAHSCKELEQACQTYLGRRRP